MSDTQMLQPVESTREWGGDSIMALTFYLRGKAWADFGRIDLAISDYDAALVINPMFTAALAERGAAWAQTGDFDRAIADYEAALRINPHDANTRLNLAFALDRQYESETRSPAVLN